MAKRIGGKARARVTYKCPKCGDYYTRGFPQRLDKSNAKKQVCSNCRPREDL